MAFPMGAAPASPTALGLLATTCLSGCWQMAIDAALLQRQQPMLRFYRWSRPTLSVGFHQRQLDPRWLERHRHGQLDLVRRPSGGGAVLHGGDICYALVLPCDRFERQRAYGRICSWLQQAMAAFGEPLRLGNERGVASPDCFASSTAADLVTHAGVKRIGSAQRWQRGWLLQHGSLQLSPPLDLWRTLLDSPPPPALSLAGEATAMADHLLKFARRHWMLPAHRGLPADESLMTAAAAELERYRLPLPGSLAVTSPLASMARTTADRARPSG